MPRVYRVVAILAAAASLLINFGIIDLIDGLTGVSPTTPAGYLIQVGGRYSVC